MTEENEDKKYTEYKEARDAEKAHELAIDDVSNAIADCSARLHKAREANNTELEEKLMAEQSELVAKRREMKTRVR